MALAEDRFHLLFNQLEGGAASMRNNLAIVGVGFLGYYTLKSVWRLGRSLYEHFAGSYALRLRLRKYGEWAVVTGCTSGVGLEFARQLASLGFDIVLMSRREEALNALATELEEMYGVKTIRVKVDFNQGQMIYDDIRDVLKDKDVGILVNNVGVMYDYPQYFASLQNETIWQIMMVNMAAATMLTHMVLTTTMLAKKQGLVLFMSSSACYYPTPQMSVYAATKKYLDYLASSLHAEYSTLGIHIQSLIPFYLATNMTRYSVYVGKPSILSPHPSTFVKHALWTAGMTNRTTGYFPHTVQLWLLSWVPERLWIWCARYLMTFFRNGAQKES